MKNPFASTFSGGSKWIYTLQALSLRQSERTYKIKLNSKLKNTFISAFLSTIPIMTGYIILGLGFGIIFQSRGYGVLWAFASSVFIYAGSMQYFAIDLFSGGASLITAAIATLMVNGRHLFYGISMLEKYKKNHFLKPYMIFALTDETYSVVCSKEESDNVDMGKYYFLVSLFNQIYWVLGCTAGALLGDIFSIKIQGLDFALTALFVCVMVEQWLKTKNHLPALIGLFSTLLSLLIFGKNAFLIPSMILITVLLSILPKLQRKEAKR